MSTEDDDASDDFATNHAPGSFGCHEALHMTSFLCGAIGEELIGRPAIASNPEWLQLAQQAEGALATLYSAIGVAHLDATGHAERGHYGNHRMPGDATPAARAGARTAA